MADQIYVRRYCRFFWHYPRIVVAHSFSASQRCLLGEVAAICLQSSKPCIAGAPILCLFQNARNYVDRWGTGRQKSINSLHFYSVADVIFLDNVIAEGFGYGFGFGVDLQLFIDVSEMEGDGVDADAKFSGSGLVVVTFNQQF